LTEHDLRYALALSAAKVETGEVAHGRQAHRPQALAGVVHRDAPSGDVGKKPSH
jgi:hypothetical protein